MLAMNIYRLQIKTDYERINGIKNEMKQKRLQ